MENDVQVCFVDPERKRKVSYDDVYSIVILDGAIRIFCLDGFTTVLECRSDIQVTGVIF